MPTFPKRRPDLVDRTVDGERVLLDSEKNLIHKLNATASAIWDRCDGDTSVEAICEQLAAEFDRKVEEIGSDVETLIDQLVGLGVLEVDTAES